MKLNIEELARESLGPEPIAYFGVYKEELEAFARSIVERCAVTVESLFDMEDDSCNEAEQCAAAIRNLLEAE